MKVVQSEVISRIAGPIQLDLPRVLVAAPTTAASARIAHALRDVGYVVSTAVPGSAVVRALRNQKSIELLVLDVSDRSWTLDSIVDAARAINWALPIIVIAQPDPAVRAEAERLGVDAILDAPAVASEIRSAATKMVPVVPDVVLDVPW